MGRIAPMLALTFAIGIAVGVIGEKIVYAQQVPDPRVADLVGAGRIRVGLGVVSPLSATKDPVTGELRGMATDLAHALALRIGVELLPVEYPSPPRVLEGLKVGAWDVGFLGIDPSRLAQVDFSTPYLQVDSTYLVLAGSPIRNVTDADQPGVRIAATRSSAEEVALSGMLVRAEFIRGIETVSAGFELLRAGKVDVLAGPRPSLLDYSTRLAGSRVLEDRFHAVFSAIMVPKGQAGRLAYVNEFVEEAKASGLVQRAIERAGLRGVQVAPAGNPSTK